MDAVDQHGDSSDLVGAAQRWVASFGAAPLAPEDASDLVAGALKITEAVSQAARELTWQTPDAFVSAMRCMEQAGGR